MLIQIALIFILLHIYDESSIFASFPPVGRDIKYQQANNCEAFMSRDFKRWDDAGMGRAAQEIHPWRVL